MPLARNIRGIAGRLEHFGDGHRVVAEVAVITVQSVIVIDHVSHRRLMGI